MENVSIGLDQYLIVDILIGNVRARRTRRRNYTYTVIFHHGLSVKLLANTCGIDLDKANHTLEL